MATTTQKITENVTVGSADIFINGLDVGHLKDTIEFHYVREKISFKPANMLGEVQTYCIRENCEIRAKTAELNMNSIRLALGVDNTTVTASTTFPAMTGSCSYTPAAGSSWDSMTFGGDKSERSFCLLLRHTRPNNKVFGVVLYKAISMTELMIPFLEDDFTLQDFVLKGLADSTRAANDQIGFMFDETNQA
jgi:hypothetical protein